MLGLVSRLSKKIVFQLSAFYFLVGVFTICLLSLNQGFDVLAELSSTQFNSLGAKILAMQVFLLCVFTFNLILIFVSRDPLSENKTTRSLWVLGACWSIFVFLPSAASSEVSRDFFTKYFYAFGVGHLFPNFSDLRGTIAAMNKVRDVGDSFQIDCLPIEEPCLGWRWTYGSAILKFPNFGIILEKNAPVFALMFFLIFLSCLWKITQSKLDVYLLSFFTLTGSSLLIVERMNIDLLALPLIHLLSKLAKMNLAKSLVVFSFFLAFTLTKFYTIPLFIAFMLLRRGKAERIFYFLATSLGSLMILGDIKVIGTNSYNFGYAATHGLKVLSGFASGQSFPKVVFSSISTYVVLITLISTFTIFFKIYSRIELPNIDQDSKNLCLLAYLLFATTWLLSSNYPYRLVSTVAFIPLLTTLLKSRLLLGSLNIGLLYATFLGIHISLSPLRNVFAGLFFVSMSALCIRLIQKYPILESEKIYLLNRIRKKESSGK